MIANLKHVFGRLARMFFDQNNYRLANEEEKSVQIKKHLETLFENPRRQRPNLCSFLGLVFLLNNVQFNLWNAPQFFPNVSISPVLQRLLRNNHLTDLTIVVLFNRIYESRFLYQNELFAVRDIAGALVDAGSEDWLPEVIGELVAIRHYGVADFVTAFGAVKGSSVKNLIIYFENGPHDEMPSTTDLTRFMLTFSKLERFTIWLEPTCGNDTEYWRRFRRAIQLNKEVTQLEIIFRNATACNMVNLSEFGQVNQRQLTMGLFTDRIENLIHRLHQRKLNHLSLCCDESSFFDLQRILRDEPGVLGHVRSFSLRLKTATCAIANPVQDYPFEGFAHFFPNLPKLKIFRLEYTSLVVFASPLVRNPLRLIFANNCVTDLTLMGIAICRLTCAASIAVPSVTSLTIVLPETTEFFSFLRRSLSLSRPTDPVRLDHFWAIIFCVYPSIKRLHLVGSVWEINQENLETSLNRHIEENGLNQSFFLRASFSEFILPDEE